ncbi:MAG TPA: bifunctional nuclease family protein [Phycisphaerales bacterium]|nr:bifunctional nuclease family protein [Phycisphaerales bacterium]
MAVRMELSRILIRELNDYQIIELREVTEGEEAKKPTASVYDAADEGGHARSFPIVIGLPEAQSIERRLKGISIKRPQTHDLLASVIDKLGASLDSITINDLAEHTFFATLDVTTAEGKKMHIDSRPSDAIALGIAGGVPIYVAEHVLEAATRDEV